MDDDDAPKNAPKRTAGLDPDEDELSDLAEIANAAAAERWDALVDAYGAVEE